MRFAGTCRRYSKRAMPHETRAAIHHGFALRCFRCPYHAKVMNRLEAVRRSAVGTSGWTADMEAFRSEAGLAKLRAFYRRNRWTIPEQSATGIREKSVN